MPVAAEVGRVHGDDDQVADPDADLLVAARAAVGLAGLVRLDPAELYLGIAAHSSATAITARAASTIA